MFSPYSAEFTLSFYLWEQRGRGWNLSETEIPLEPAFRPFRYDPNLLINTMYGDPQETFVESLVKGFLDELAAPGSGLSFESLLGGIDDKEPYSQNGRPVVIGLGTGSDAKHIAEQLEHFLISLSLSRNPIGFELVGTGDRIHVQLVSAEADHATVERQLRINFPELAIEKKSDALDLFWSPNRPCVLVDFGLEDEFIRPLQSFSEFDLDPLTGLVGALEDVRNEELGVVQILFQSTRHPWSESIIRSVSDQMGKSLFVNAPEMVSLARDKIKHPLFASVVRIAVQSSQRERTRAISENISAALKATSRPGVNSLIPLSNAGYDEEDHIKDIFHRTTHRTGMILNSMEIATLVHPPSQSISSRKLQTERRKSKAAPKEVMGHDLVLGENTHQGNRILVSLATEQRLRHVHIIGATGTGKSTLILNMITQDMERGRGLAVLDPHGDLIDRVLERVPEARFQDVMLFDPSDTVRPVGLNILNARSEIEKHVLVSDLVGIFRRFATSWGDQMTTVLGNAVSAIVESEEKATLADLKRFLSDKGFRTTFLKHVRDPHVVYFWDKEFHLLRGNPESSILTRLDTFLRPKLIRNVVDQQEGLDVGRLVNNKNILLLKLTQGIIGEENAYLLGSLFVSKLHQVVVARQAQITADREAFFLYVDEFQHFVTPSMGSMLTGARKFGLGLVLAHQDLRQLWDLDKALANSIISNAGTRICFRLGDFDAAKLADGFAHFDASDLQNLGVGEAIARVERRDCDFNLRTTVPPAVTPEVAGARKEQIIEISRRNHGHSVNQPVEVGIKEVIPVVVERRPEPQKPREMKADAVPPNVGKPAVPPVSVSTGEQEVSRHRYLQTLIKQMAEQRGYRAVIEEPIADGGGRVDVGLERNGKRIACEISVTTGDVQELHNIEKCLRAGYDSVLVCSPEKKNLEAIRKLMAERLSPADQSKILFFEPQDLILFLDEQVAQEAGREERVKGYRVKVQYHAVSEAEKQKKRDAVAQVIGQALRRMKEKS